MVQHATITMTSSSSSSSFTNFYSFPKLSIPINKTHILPCISNKKLNFDSSYKLKSHRGFNGFERKIFRLPMAVPKVSRGEISNIQGNNYNLSLELKRLLKEGRINAALQLIDDIEKQASYLDSSSFASLLQACIDCKSLVAGRRLHDHIIGSSTKPISSSNSIFNKLVELYCKLGSSDDALKVLEEMPQQNLDSWNQVLMGFAENGKEEEAMRIFTEMKSSGIRSDQLTFRGVLMACQSLGALEEGMTHFESMTREYGITPLMEHYVSIVDLLGKSGKIDEAEEFISKMPIQTRDRFRRTCFS